MEDQYIYGNVLVCVASVRLSLDLSNIVDIGKLCVYPICMHI